jgi:hypothetical protein
MTIKSLLTTTFAAFSLIVAGQANATPYETSSTTTFSLGNSFVTVPGIISADNQKAFIMQNPQIFTTEVFGNSDLWNLTRTVNPGNAIATVNTNVDTNVNAVGGAGGLGGTATIQSGAVQVAPVISPVTTSNAQGGAATIQTGAVQNTVAPVVTSTSQGGNATGGTATIQSGAVQNLVNTASNAVVQKGAVQNSNVSTNSTGASTSAANNAGNSQVVNFNSGQYQNDTRFLSNFGSVGSIAPCSDGAIAPSLGFNGDRLTAAITGTLNLGAKSPSCDKNFLLDIERIRGQYAVEAARAGRTEYVNTPIINVNPSVAPSVVPTEAVPGVTVRKQTNKG